MEEDGFAVLFIFLEILDKQRKMMYNACCVTNVIYQEVYMSEFSKKHPRLAETGDSLLSLLSGSFAFIAVLTVGIKQFIKKREDK